MLKIFPQISQNSQILRRLFYFSAQNLRDLRDLREKKIVLKIVPADLTELAGPSQIILFFCAKSAGSAGSAGEKILCLKIGRAHV